MPGGAPAADDGHRLALAQRGPEAASSLPVQGQGRLLSRRKRPWEGGIAWEQAAAAGPLEPLLRCGWMAEGDWTHLLAIGLDPLEILDVDSGSAQGMLQLWSARLPGLLQISEELLELLESTPAHSWTVAPDQPPKAMALLESRTPAWTLLGVRTEGTPQELAHGRRLQYACTIARRLSLGLVLS